MKHKESYYENVKRNSFAALFIQTIQILLGFILRKIFIDTLGVEFLGYNSVFSNILQLLNLADLGIGTAITGFLYAPIAQKDRNKISALLLIYKKIYRFVALIVLIFGFIIAANLNIILKDANYDFRFLKVLFLINLLGTVATYFLAYKRTYVIAEQKSYIVLSTDAVVNVTITLLQIFLLIFQKSYILYLILNISKGIISNIVCGLYYDSHYKALYIQRDKELVHKYGKQIGSYAKDVFVDRIGATIYNGTDNIIISAVKGSVLVGYLANYTMISLQVSLVTNQVLNSVQATLGHFISTTENYKKKQYMFQNYFFIVFLMANFVVTCFFQLISPFITLWLGIEFLLPISTAVLLAIDLYFTVWMQFLSQFFVIYRLHKYDKWIVFLIAILNIIISFYLIGIYGINGTLIGTIGTRFICIVLRIVIITQKAFEESAKRYLKKTLVYFIYTGVVNYIIFYVLSRNSVVGSMNFIVHIVIVFMLSVLLPMVVFAGTPEEHFVLDRIKYNFRRNEK